MKQILQKTQKLAAVTLAALFLSMPFTGIAAASEINHSSQIALSKYDDGSWHKGKYEGRGTGRDDGSWYEGKYDKHHKKPQHHDRWDRKDKEGRRFECDRCGRSFHDRADLKRHYEKRHPHRDWKNDKHHDRHDRDWNRDRDKNGNAVTGFIIGAVAGAIIANNI